MSFIKISKSILVLFVSVQLLGSIALADTPLYSIDNSNYQSHSSKLSPGQMGMFEKYSDYRMDVYSASPSCKLPDSIAAISKTNGSMINSNEGIEVPNAGQRPFPNPTEAQHFIWNYRMNPGYTAFVHRFGTTYGVNSTGAVTIGKTDNYISFPNNPGIENKVSDSNIYALYMQKNLEPARVSGGVTLVHDFIDNVVQPRKAWQYSPATRRVRRAPDITYDTLLDQGGGIVTVDQYGSFNGAQDRHNWEYRGSKTMIVVYNNFDVMNAGSSLASTKNFPNPDVMRYEERTVHEVHGAVKSGSRHLYAGRTMFFTDDDMNWLAEQNMYDGQGNLMRIMVSPQTSNNAGFCRGVAEITMDYATQTYVANNVFGESHSGVLPIYNTGEPSSTFYTPDGLRRFAR